MVDVVQDLNRDLLSLQRRSGELHEFPLDEIAGGEKEEDEKEDEGGLPGERDEAGRTPGDVLLDVDRRFFDLYPSDVFRHRIRAAGGLIGGLLHLVEWAVAAVPLHRTTEPLRCLGQLRDDGRHIVRQRVDTVDERATHHRDDHRGGENAVDVNAGEHRDNRLEGVADQDAEHDRDEGLARPVEQIHRCRDRQNRQRDAADTDVRLDRRRMCVRRVATGSDATNRFSHVQPSTVSARPARDCSALLMATPALAPSAAATTANWTSWEASPTTYTPGMHVSPR